MKKLIIILTLEILLLVTLGYFYWRAQKPIIEGEWFQTGNTQTITQFQTKTSKELLNNRIGSGSDLIVDIPTEQDVDGLVYLNTQELGVKWVRLILDHGDWSVVESTGEYSKHYIDPKYDRVITDLIDNDVNIMLVLVYWDPESPSFKEEEEQNYSRFKTEDEIQRYLDYTRFIVNHFKDKIEYYEILNEPNHCEGTQQNVKLNDYVNLVKRVVPVIHAENPNAKIVVGAVADLRQAPFREYFFDLIKSDVMPLVEGISFHSMYGISPEYDILKKYYYEYPSLIQEIKDTASAHGFNGEYIVEELTWRTPINSNPDEAWTYSDKVAAKYYARGIIINLGLDLTTMVSLEESDAFPHIVGVIRNLCTVVAGNNPIDLPIEIQSSAENIENYTFSLSNGDKLIALWTDGVAVDEDLGVNTSVTIPNFSAQNVIGIDVLEGYQQDVVTGNEGGNLIIQNLIVRDYPLILRITP